MEPDSVVGWAAPQMLAGMLIVKKKAFGSLNYLPNLSQLHAWSEKVVYGIKLMELHFKCGVLPITDANIHISQEAVGVLGQQMFIGVWIQSLNSQSPLPCLLQWKLNEFRESWSLPGLFFFLMSCIVEEIALWFLPSSAAALLTEEVPAEVPTPAQDRVRVQRCCSSGSVN